jgi:hypothetical protein
MAEGESADLDRFLSTIRTLEPLIRAHADENEKQHRVPGASAPVRYLRQTIRT